MRTVFYQVSAAIKTTSRIKKFVIQTPDYSVEKIRDILLEVHPEYSELILEKIDKPDYARYWGEDD